MLNRYLALALAVIGGIITILVGVFQDVRPMTIGYRSLISILVFGVSGYLLGSLLDSLQQRISDDIKPTGQNIDIISKDETNETIQPVAIVPTADEFRAFTADNFDRISGQ